MNSNIILIVEDVLRYAAWQIETLRKIFPENEIIHARNLREAHSFLNNKNLNIIAVFTDNGYPLVPGGERIGSKSIEGGAGTLLTRQIRDGKFGDHYQDLPIAWHTAYIDDRKVDRVMSYDDSFTQGRTKCFEKYDGGESYIEMGEYVRNVLSG